MNNHLTKLFLLLSLTIGISCSSENSNLSNEKITWKLSDGIEFPNEIALFGRKLEAKLLRH